MGEQAEKVHVIRAVVSYGTVSTVTKPTTEPVETFEADILRQYPGAVLKPSRTYHPALFKLIAGLAEEQGLSIDEVIDRREEAKAHA